MRRTPVLSDAAWGVIRRPVRRTPVISGADARPILDLIQDFSSVTDEEVEASLEMNRRVPGSDASWDQINPALMRASCAYWCSEVLRGPPEPPYNGRFLIGRHHIAWDELLHPRRNMRVLIETPRDHGKSFMVSMGVPIWYGGVVWPGSEGFIFSANSDLAEKMIFKVQNELLSNPKLEHMLPDSVDRTWNKQTVRMRGGTIIHGRGYGARVRGGHPDWIILDDVLTDEMIYSETKRSRAIDYFFSAITNMVGEDKKLIVTGTPMHWGDLYAQLQKRTTDKGGSYRVCIHQAIGPDGKALFPERYSLRKLRNKKNEIGAARFAREFMMQPLTDESSLFPRTLFTADLFEEYDLGADAAYWHARGCVVYTAVDLAISTSAGADYFVILSLAVDSRGNNYVCGIRRHRGLGYENQIAFIVDEHAHVDSEVVAVEANVYQRIIADTLINETDVPVRRFFTAGVPVANPHKRGMSSITANKHNLDRGVPGIRRLLETKKLKFPKVDHLNIEHPTRVLIETLIGELNAIGFVEGKVQSVGEHDDLVMALWIATYQARLGGGPGDEEEDAPARSGVQKDRKPMTLAVAEVVERLSARIDDGVDIGDLGCPEEIRGAVSEALYALGGQYMDAGDVDGARMYLSAAQSLRPSK